MPASAPAPRAEDPPMVAPLVEETQAPTIVPPRYGLYAAATVHTPGAGRWVNGVQYVTDACSTGSGWSTRCGLGGATVTYSITIMLTGTRTGAGTEEDPYLYSLTATASVDAGPARQVTIGGLDATTGGPAVTLLSGSPDRWDADVAVVDVDSGTHNSYPVTQLQDGTTRPDSLGMTVVEPDPDAPVKSADGLRTITGTPFMVLNGVECTPAGLGDAQAIALRRLDYTEQRSAEEAFWSGLVHGRPVDNYPTLVDDEFPADHIVAGTADAPVPLVDGVAALEEVLGRTYAGAGIIHAPRMVAAHAARYRQIAPASGAALRTVLGTAWAFGTGYPNIGPDGTAPADPTKTAWLFATGAVVVRRGPVVNTHAFDGGRNMMRAIAERRIVITLECAVWAAAVKLDSDGEVS